MVSWAKSQLAIGLGNSRLVGPVLFPEPWENAVFLRITEFQRRIYISGATISGASVLLSADTLQSGPESYVLPDLTPIDETMSSAQVYSKSESLVATLFPEYRQRVCRYAQWLLGNESDAEEIVQESFVRLAQREQKGHVIENEKQFAGLLFTTVRNLTIDLHRKRGRRRQVSLGSVSEPVAHYHDQSSAHQLNEQIAELIQDLPENWAEALKLKLTGELTYDQIAEVLQCTKAQVRTWIFRARRQLSTELAKRGWLEEEK